MTDLPDTAVVLCGLPGAGKTHVAGILARLYESPVAEQFNTPISNLIRRVKKDGLTDEQDQAVIIDSVQRLRNLFYLREVFEEVVCIHVSASSNTRAMRMIRHDSHRADTIEQAKGIERVYKQDNTISERCKKFHKLLNPLGETKLRQNLRALTEQLPLTVRNEQPLTEYQSEVVKN